jgi:hypothetical protein
MTFKSKIKRMKREDVEKMLCDRELDAIDWDTVYNILMEGCRGYENMDIVELAEQYKNYFNEEIFIDY